MKNKKVPHKVKGVNGHKEVDNYVNECAMQKIVSLLVAYQLRNDNEYESFETFIEVVCKTVYGAQQYEDLKSMYEKKIKKKIKKEEKG